MKETQTQNIDAESHNWNSCYFSCDHTGIFVYNEEQDNVMVQIGIRLWLTFVVYVDVVVVLVKRSELYVTSTAK